MPRLIDDIRAADRIAAPWFVGRKAKAWTALAEALGRVLREGVKELPVILIDNVADYYYSTEQEFWDVTEDFPNLAPPFPAFWMEHRMPRRIHSKEKGDTDMHGLTERGRVGLLVQALDPVQVKGQDIPANTRWILWLEMFLDYGLYKRPIEGPHGSIFVCVDEHGLALDHLTMQSYADEEYVELMKDLMTWTHPSLLAITFLHCKNVRIDENAVPKPLAKKYREKHNGVQPVAYKTLVIEPLKQVLRTQGRSGEVGLAKALHICRGHFRDYREGRGLFGKYHALVWTPMTIRGTQKGKETPPAREIEVKI